jgi:hypothetical protein
MCGVSPASVKGLEGVKVASKVPYITNFTAFKIQKNAGLLT